MDINEIQQIIPHRYPMLLIDRVIELEPLKKIVAIKNVTMNEQVFQGHFPGAPVYPGVYIIEAMAHIEQHAVEKFKLKRVPKPMLVLGEK